MQFSSSLPGARGSVATGQRGFLRRLFAFAGPAYLVSVGYMDPGNWATDLEGGSRFGYQLLWVLVVSNFIALLLQTLSSRLGIVTGRDLAQACRDTYPASVNWVLWVFCEAAIAACDLAELLGAAIALQMLFGMPLLAGVLLISFDTLLLLALGHFGIRMIEAIVIGLVVVIGGCFAVEIFLARPQWAAMASGLVPSLNCESLYVAIGILGATVMPHNLYLHSALVQTRRIGDSIAEKRAALRFNLIDSTVALNAALLVNGGILVLAASTFHARGIPVNDLRQAHELLSPLLASGLASFVFAVALFCAGQSSTITGTMAGQIVMEGFVSLRMSPWLRRLATRLLAMLPAVFIIWLYGEESVFDLLVLSQVVLSLQLPFAIVPLVQFTADRKRMGELATPTWMHLLATLASVVIIALNTMVVWRFVAEQSWAWPFAAAPAILLLWLMLYPVLPRGAKGQAQPGSLLPREFALSTSAPAYRRILVPLDHSDRDRSALAHAAQLARQHDATLYLLHIEEGVTSQVYGPLARTSEVEEGERYLEQIATALRAEKLQVDVRIMHARTPSDAIVQAATSIQPDLLIMGAHGHTGLQDLIFGATINTVRHSLKTPLLIVRDEPLAPTAAD
jgi:manganese transport protein